MLGVLTFWIPPISVLSGFNQAPDAELPPKFQTRLTESNSLFENGLLTLIYRDHPTSFDPNWSI